MSKIVLGKGLEALIPGDGDTAVDDRKLRMVPLDRIAPNPMQPRHDFGEAGLAELAESLRVNGVIQPLVVMANGAGYTIVVGERRFRAARLSGMTEVPAVVLDGLDEGRMLELALVENLQRENLGPLEVAEAYRMLIEKCGLTQREVAEKVGKSRAAVTNSLRLLMLPEQVQTLIRQKKLSEGHARALLAAESEEEMARLAQRILHEALSVRDTEEAVRTGRRRRLVPKRVAPAVADAESYLKSLLGTSVKIKHGLRRGTIRIEYYGTDDLTRLLELFRRVAQ